MAPVVSLYMLTRRLRYDPSLVHSLIILPVVTAGIFPVIENSLARGLLGILSVGEARLPLGTTPEERAALRRRIAGERMRRASRPA